MKGCRKCMANEGHIADGDNAVISLLGNGSLRYKCFSASCKKSRYFSLPEVVLSMVDDPPENLVPVLKTAMPPEWLRLYDRMGASLGQLRARDLALEALELGAMSGGRLLRCADSHAMFSFEEHTFREIHDEVGALYKRWIGPLEENIKGLHSALSELQRGYDQQLKAMAKKAASDDTSKAEVKEIADAMGVLQSILFQAGLGSSASTLWKAFSNIGLSGAGGVPACMTHQVTQNDLNMDSNPHLMGCRNGVLDLRTGELRDGRPDDRITMTVDYNMEIRPPSARFLNDIVGRIFPVPKRTTARTKASSSSSWGHVC